MENTRQADFAIDPQFTDRWSPRAFDGTSLTDEEMNRLFEAARWAPSSFNSQPWRFLYTRRDQAEWELFLSLLIPFNQDWARTAGCLILAVSDSLMPAGRDGERKTSHSHSFDTGAAVAMLALQARHMGLYAHAMTGVDFDAARQKLNLPETHRPECMVAVGRIGDPAVLPEKLREREVPSPRRQVREFAFVGALPAG